MGGGVWVISTPLALHHPHSVTTSGGAARRGISVSVDVQEHGDVWQESVWSLGVHGGGPCVRIPM